MKSARLRADEVTYSDRISRLPDELLFKILSLIPVSDAMSTSLLSKEWKSLWKMMPTLYYDEKACSNIGSHGFDEFCGRSLQLHKAHVLKTLILKLSKHSDSLHSLVFPNINSTLHEITSTSTSYPCCYSYISFPDNAKVFQTLVFLKLEGIISLDFVNSPACFPSLKSLHLIRVALRGEESFYRLFSACPLLENLVFERLSRCVRSSFTISVPSLQRLSITKDDCCCSDDDPRFEINAPSLKYLKVKHFIGSFNVVEDMPKLVDADVAVHHSQTENFFRSFTSVKFLSIHLDALMVLALADRIFHQLLYLDLHTENKIPRNLLLYLLKHFPKLRVLKLHERHWRYSSKIKDQPRSVCDPSSVPECLYFHLETFQWRGYEGIQEEKEVMLYILQNASCLKTARISIYSEGPRDGDNDLMIIKELKSMCKASNSCQLVIST